MAQKILPSQRLFKQFQEQILSGQLDLPDVVRLGAQLMLQHAVELEMTQFLQRTYYTNDVATTQQEGRRNGYASRTVLTGEGPIQIDLPQARDVPQDKPRFQSQILKAYATRTETLDELITRMYVLGMSTRDIETAFLQVFVAEGVSKSTVSRITERLNEDLEAFRQRDLSQESVLYLFLDGIYLKYHLEAKRKESVLVAYCIRANGKKVLLHIGPGHRESYDHWKSFLHEMIRRGLKMSLLVITDGNPGVIDAVEEVFPFSLRQRCQKHRMKNILSKAPEEVADILKGEIHRAFHADSYDEGLKIGRQLVKKYRTRFPAAMACLEEDLEACLQCLKLPEEHRNRIRTTNLLERLFGENRRRVKVIPHFFSEKAGIKLVYATLVAASQRWRGVRMTPEISQAIDALWEQCFGRSRIQSWAA